MRFQAKHSSVTCFSASNFSVSNVLLESWDKKKRDHYKTAAARNCSSLDRWIYCTSDRCNQGKSEIHSAAVRATRLTSPGPKSCHAAQKPLASQAILLQASDWTFLYDLDGQLQFPIEAAVTSLRRVLFSRSSKTIVLLELTVTVQDNVHLAHDRKISKHSGLVTACEENGFKTHMFALEVGCLGHCPHSFLHCFKALGLPTWSRQRARSNPRRQKPHFVHRMFFGRGMPTCECQAVLYWTLLTSFRISLFLSSLLSHFRFVPFAVRDNSFRFQAYTQPALAFRFLQLADVVRTRCIFQFSHAPVRNKSPSSQSLALCLFFVTWSQRCVCGLSTGGSLSF